MSRLAVIAVFAAIKRLAELGDFEGIADLTETVIRESEAGGGA